MSPRVGDLVAERATNTFVGRAFELRILLDALKADGPSVIHVHGIAGVGKSSLLGAFVHRAREQGAAVVQFDCRSLEPTERRFLDHLATELGQPSGSVEEAAEAVGALGERVIVALDSYELFRLLDTWLRQAFVPVLDRHVRVILVGREPPVAGWLATPGWEGMFRGLTLGPLDEVDALSLLEGAGVGAEEGQRLNRAVHGHPLALRLAASAALQRDSLDLQEVAIQSVVQELARLYLSDVRDVRTRRALEAASVVRRMTLPLLESMLPEAPAQEVFARLRRLPFAEVGSDGLRLHEAVQQAISTELRSVAPDLYRGYRRAAWRHLRTELRTGGSPDLWRYTADMLYLLENPLVREGFFPSGAQEFVVEPARPADGTALMSIVARYDGPEGQRLIRGYWDRAIDAFHVVRRRDERIVGFYLMLDNLALDRAPMEADPVGARWLDHLRRDPLTRGQRAVFVRRWLSEEHGEGLSAVQASCWLDSKRTVMALRPSLRRCYLAMRDLDPYLPFVTKLEFRELPEATATVDGAVFRTALLDWGPTSVDGWLARLVADELGIIEDDGRILDVAARELVVDGRRASLTKLEFGVMRTLCEHEGKVVSRARLIEDVWGYDFVGESNVVDVIVRGLRQKLGPCASTIETVRGAGYRFKRALSS